LLLLLLLLLLLPARMLLLFALTKRTSASISCFWVMFDWFP